MNTRRKSSIVTAIHLSWWEMRALSKAHKRFNQPGRSVAYQAATIAFDAMKSASRFDCAAEIAGQEARMMFNLMAVSYRTFSLGHMYTNRLCLLCHHCHRPRRWQ